MTSFDTDALTLGDVVTTGKGAKQANICGLKGEAVAATLDVMQVAFAPSAYNDPEATRVSIVFRPSEAVLEQLGKVDDWIVTSVAENATKFFGKPKGFDAVKEMYQPIVRPSEKYGPSIKAKLNISGPGEIRCWDEHRSMRDQPQEWKGASVKPRLWLRSLYFMGGSFGATLECTDVQILSEASAECPF